MVNGPDIFPINIAVDDGTLVIRSAEGNEGDPSPERLVAAEADGRDPDTHYAWKASW